MMEFRIADTFTQSLARLTAEEQKQVKQTAFDAQVNPASPGLAFHKLDKVRDKNFWSLRAGSDIRIIAHRTANSVLFAMWIIMTMHTTGPSAANWKCTQKPGPLNLWNCARQSAKLKHRSISPLPISETSRFLPT